MNAAVIERLTQDDLPGLFERIAGVFERQRAFLIELDGKVGDGDLGITMQKGFAAALAAVREHRDGPVGKTLQRAGMAIAKAAPSTMGTLMATGFMQGGKALGDAGELGPAQLATFWRAFHDGIVARGKARPGDKTLVDVLGPTAQALEAGAAEGRTLGDALDAALAAARSALDATKSMVAQHGKAACFQEKSLGLEDAGATAAFLLVEALRDHVHHQEASP